MCSLARAGKITDTKLALFTANKHLELADPALKVDVQADKDQAVFTITSRSLARFVQLSLEEADVVFSDNYFDVPVGWPVTVTAPIPSGWSLDQVKQALRVVSLYDSF